MIRDGLRHNWMKQERNLIGFMVKFRFVKLYLEESVGEESVSEGCFSKKNFKRSGFFDNDKRLRIVNKHFDLASGKDDST